MHGIDGVLRGKKILSANKRQTSKFLHINRNSEKETNFKGQVERR